MEVESSQMNGKFSGRSQDCEIDKANLANKCTKYNSIILDIRNIIQIQPIAGVEV